MHGLPAPGDGDQWNSSSSNSGKVARKNNLTKLVWMLKPLGGGNSTSMVIDSPGSCPTGPANKWTFEGGLLRVSQLCLTAAVAAGGSAAAVSLEPCGGTGQQHWTRDASSRFHLGNATGRLCLNGFEPYTPPNTKLQTYPCSATPGANEQWTIDSNGSLISTKGGCVRSRTVETAAVQLNTTVWHTLNTSATAPGNYPPLTPGMPRQRQPPTNHQKTLLLYHNGHETATCSPNYDGVIDYFNELGCGGASSPPCLPTCLPANMPASIAATTRATPTVLRLPYSN